MSKLALYIPEPLKRLSAPWFAPVSEKHLFTKDLPPNFFETLVEKVSDPASARAIVLPNNFKTLDAEAASYIRTYADLGEKLNIPVFVFSLGDFTHDVRFDRRVYVFRFSTYRSEIGSHDIVMPTSTEDPPEELLHTRTKKTKPTVSFCGMGGFPSTKDWVKYYIKNFIWDIKALFRESAKAKKIGVYWRRKMMRVCERSNLVETHFIVRRTFSGLRKTIEVDPKLARKEYLNSIAEADFVLAPKGDGNYSNRFLKTLAFGRIPVLVDTEVVLPLENVIDYSKIVVRVPMDRVHNTPRYIREFYDALSEEEWASRQRLARNVFEEYLRQDSFFRYFFSHAL